MEQTKRYWQENGLQDFWWGNGFSKPGEVQECSYRLARILFHLLAEDHRQRLQDFVRHAHADDAGESAAHEFLGKSLAELVAQFLGTGAWEPKPYDAASYCRRAAFYSGRGQSDRALADLGEAIRLVPDQANAYASRGFAYCRLGQHALATQDYEKAIQLNPTDHYAYNSLAWLLATCPEEEHRDGGRAVEYATKACELCGFEFWYCLGTLAAAYAEVGDFEEARTWAKESLRRAPEEERAGCKERLKLYKDGTPYREVIELPSTER